MKKNEKKYYYKVISSGDVLEIYSYQYAQYKELPLDDLLDEVLVNEELEKEKTLQVDGAMPDSMYSGNKQPVYSLWCRTCNTGISACKHKYPGGLCSCTVRYFNGSIYR